MKGKGPGEQLEDDHAERVEVRGRADVLSRQLLWRHVGGRAQRKTAAGLLTQITGDAEIQERHPSIFTEEDVGRFDVAVDEPAAVHVVERAAEVSHEHQQLRGREGCSAQPRSQRLAAQMLHHEKGLSLLLPHRIDGDDGGVLEPRQQAGFVLEASHEGRARQERAGQQLHRHLPAELQVHRPVHAPHPAFPHQGFDPPRPREHGAGGDGRARRHRNHGSGVGSGDGHRRGVYLRRGPLQNASTWPRAPSLRISSFASSPEREG